MTPQQKKFFFKTQLSTLFFALTLFISAGTFSYLQAWLYWATTSTAFMNYWTIRNNETLMTERSQVGENTKQWDKIILGVSALMYLLNMLVAGLDAGRFHWSPLSPIWLNFIGIGTTISGQFIFLTARSQNSFFSSVVRIQSERGHTVCDTGLYKTIRHPGYLGMIIALMGIPLITGSLYCWIPTGIAILLIVIRTGLEDQTLQKELKGYEDYQLKTRYRLVKGLW